MKNLKYSVGIDISKDDFKACFVVIDESHKVTIKSTSTFANTATGFSSFLSWSLKHSKEDLPLFFLAEATGVYHEQLAWFLHMQKMNVSIVLANKAKSYLQSLGVKSKNDKIDAKGLAQMGAEKSLPLWSPLSNQLYTLRALTRLHEDLQNQRTAFKNQLHALQFSMHKVKKVEDTLKKMIKVVEKEVAKTEDQIEALIKGDEKLKVKYKNITAIKGISLISFAVIVAETNGFELFANKAQLVSYAGYDVVENQSGKRAGKTRISKKGNSHIRRVLHMPALVAVKHDPAFKKFYTRIYERTNIKMKGYVAVQKKLLCLMYSLWKKNEMYQANYKTKHSEAETADPLLVGSERTLKKKPDPKVLASLDEHSSALTASPLLVLQN
ncbi:MAG TPA: IS110 family transposase [Flavisolibacter sp.]|jgi:transposase